MSFWKTFGFHTVSAVDTILDSGDFTLEQLLDEEEILQETKSQNKKLIDFLIKPSTLRQLLLYVVMEPEPKDDDAEESKRRFKYPFLACEILASEVWSIIDAFFAQKDLLEDLYAFFDKDPPLNSLLASYTSRVASVFLQKKVSETISFLKERKNTISNFLKHLGNASVMDLLLKIIACEDTTDGAGILQWLCTTELISSLISKFDPNQPVDVHENAAQALADIITVSMNSTSSPLIAQLESEEIVKTLFGYILSNGLSSSLLQGLSVLIELLRRHIKDQHDDSTKLEDLPPLLRIITENLDKFHGFLKSKEGEQGKVLLQPIGPIQPLGFHKLKIIEFITALTRTNTSSIDTEIMKQGVIGSCLDLFFTHQWNNFLHSFVEQIISQILEGENEVLKIHLLRDAGLLDKICQASKENEEEMTKPKGVRRGYMGHITSISINIMNTASVVPAVEKVLSEHEEWIKYSKGALASTRERESKIIGGYMPTDFNADDDDLDEQNEGDLNYDTSGQSRENYNSYDGFGISEEEEEDEDEEDEEANDDMISANITTTVSEEVWEEKIIEDTSTEDQGTNTTPKEEPEESKKSSNNEKESEKSLDAEEEESKKSSQNEEEQATTHVEVSV